MFRKKRRPEAEDPTALDDVAKRVFGRLLPKKMPFYTRKYVMPGDQLRAQLVTDCGQIVERAVDIDREMWVAGIVVEGFNIVDIYE